MLTLTVPIWYLIKASILCESKPLASSALPLGGVWSDLGSGVLVHLFSGSGHPRTPPIPPHTFESCLPSQKIFPYMFIFYFSTFPFCSKVKRRQLRAWVFRVPVHTSAAVRIWSSHMLQKRVMTWDILMLKVQCHEINNILKKVLASFYENTD